MSELWSHPGRDGVIVFELVGPCLLKRAGRPDVDIMITRQRGDTTLFAFAVAEFHANFTPLGPSDPLETP